MISKESRSIGVPVPVIYKGNRLANDLRLDLIVDVFFIPSSRISSSGLRLAL